MQQFLTWLLLDRRSLRRALVLGALIGLVEALVLVIAGLIDHSLRLPGDGLGLLEHPGIAAVVVADFVVLGLLGFAVSRFLRLARRVPVVPTKANRRLLRRAVARGREVLLLKGPARRWFWLGSGLGTLFWLQNALQTRDPISNYGNDVFDSALHPLSYLTFRIVLWLSWAVLYPYVAIAFLGMSGNIYRVTRQLALRRQLTHQMFHPDGSGGYGCLGDINFAAIMAVFTLYCSLGIVVFTHQHLNPLQIAGFIILSTALIWLTFRISWPVSKFLAKERRAEDGSSYRKLSRRPDQFALLTRLWLRSGASFSPYAGYQKALIQGIRFVPAVIAGARLLWAD